jgi:hypothetical protein
VALAVALAVAVAAADGGSGDALRVGDALILGVVDVEATAEGVAVTGDAEAVSVPDGVTVGDGHSE